jgi:geranylgeranyl transferase type-2 subunit beta
MAILNNDRHVQYILQLEKNQSELSYHLTAHLRINGIYWGTTSLYLLGEPMDQKAVLSRVMKCQNENGGFGGDGSHDSHILFTLSAIQILITLGGLDQLDKLKTRDYILGLKQDDGSFAGDEWGEIDTRFVYCAVSCLSLLGYLDDMDKIKTVSYLVKCQNFDGGINFNS